MNLNKETLYQKNMSLSVDEVSSKIYSNMSVLQKLEQVFQLRETSWALKTAGVRAQHPEWSEKQVQDFVRKIFLYAST